MSKRKSPRPRRNKKRSFQVGPVMGQACVRFHNNTQDVHGCY